MDFDKSHATDLSHVAGIAQEAPFQHQRVQDRAHSLVKVIRRYSQHVPNRCKKLILWSQSFSNHYLLNASSETLARLPLSAINTGRRYLTNCCQSVQAPLNRSPVVAGSQIMARPDRLRF